MRISKSIVAIFACVMVVTGSVHAQGIDFHKQVWDSVLTEAKQQDKLIFVDCYTTWCGPCKKMDKNVFPQEKVGEFYNKNFINVKLDMEKGVGNEVRKKYDVRAFPTYLFVNGNGEIVHRSMSAMSAEALIALGKTALDPSENLMGLRKQYENGDRSPELIQKYLRTLEKCTYEEKYQEVLAWYVHSMPPEKLFTEENFSLLTGGVKANFAVVEFLVKYQDRYKSVVGPERYKNAVLGKMVKVFDDIYSEESQQALESAFQTIAEYTPTLAEQAKDLAVVRYLGSNNELAKMKQKSIEYVRDYLVDSPESMRTIFMLRRIARGEEGSEQLYSEAAEAVEKLLEQDPESENRIRDYYALFLYRAGELEKAKQQAQLVVENASEENVKRLHSKREILAE